ncbi:MAG: deoxyribonuclease V [Chloroflexota bacterium]|nr:deoxyribonuclease V [Chloroflexota bacterium]
MEATTQQRWDVTPQEAITIQQRLRFSVVTKNRLGAVHTVAGVDVGFWGEVAQAAVVVLRYPELEPVDYVLSRRPVTFPYVPGLLAFREGPVVVDALEQLRADPDLLIFDGHGLAHPRRMGIATHIGVLMDRPSIGCAKSRLCGEHHQPAEVRGSMARLTDGDEVIGMVVRTRNRVNPVYVSIGHKVDLETAVTCVLRCCRKYRLPEPIRHAHRVAGGQHLSLTVSQPSLF